MTGLDPETWDRVNRELIAKLLTELTFEEVLRPEPDSDPGSEPDSFSLPLSPAGTLRYRARLRRLGHRRVDSSSLRWHGDEIPSLPDADRLLALLAPRLGVGPSTAAGLIDELASTLLSDVWQLTHGLPADELAEADQATVEGEMRGHPWYVANKGRVGLDVDELAVFAPEARRPLRLLWLAAAPGRADVHTVPGLDHARVIREQVAPESWEELRRQAAAGGLDPDTATYLPIHPWQWRNRILRLHAADMARGTLVPLGALPERYLPQQAIRTLADADHPERRYMKLPLSILNTSVHRGLPRDLALVAPALTHWFTTTLGRDEFLAEKGLILLGEVASVSVAHPALESVPDIPYQHTEMLGAIWRESVAGKLGEGERAITLAALLHRDPVGVPFLGPVVEGSGLDVADWVDRLHEAVLPPLVHVLYRYGATFSPHGQNCLLVLRAGAPARLVVKDFVDDAVVAAEALPEQTDMPDRVRQALDHGLDGSEIVRWIQGGLLLCVYRYLSELFEDHFGYSEDRFWASARQSLRSYQARFEDELADRFEQFNLQTPTFAKLCLNRLRLFDRGYADDAERPVISVAGQVDNPLA